MGLFTGFRGPVNAILTMLLLLGNGLQCQASFGCQKTPYGPARPPSNAILRVPGQWFV